MAVKLNVRMELPDKEPKEFVYDFDQDVITLGRDSSNDIQIPLTTVSRHHAKILKEGKDYFLQDLGSTHGTTHNGKPMGPKAKRLLRSGDTIELMHFRITFESRTDQPLALGQAETTQMLAQKMVREVLSAIGTGKDGPYLRVMNGPEEGKRHELPEGVGEVVIGRATECDFSINDANISRRHALVRKDWSGITIEDLGSKNGVALNDKKIDKAAPLKDGDEIALGAVKITFVDPTAGILGKLDDLPVFKTEAPPEEEAAPAASGDSPSVEMPAAADAEAPAVHGETGSTVDGEGDAGAEEAPAQEGSKSEDGKEARAADYLFYAAIGLTVLGILAIVALVALW